MQQNLAEGDRGTNTQIMPNMWSPLAKLMSAPMTCQNARFGRDDHGKLPAERSL